MASSLTDGPHRSESAGCEQNESGLQLALESGWTGVATWLSLLAFLFLRIFRCPPYFPQGVQVALYKPPHSMRIITWCTSQNSPL